MAGFLTTQQPLRSTNGMNGSCLSLQMIKKTVLDNRLLIKFPIF